MILRSLLAPRAPLLTSSLPVLFRTTTRTIRSVAKHPRENPYNSSTGLPLLSISKESSRLRRLASTPLRTGCLATKKGMTGLYDSTTARRTPCTVLQLDRAQVISHKTLRTHGYFAVQVGSGSREARNVPRPEQGHFSGAGVPLKRDVREFRVADASGLTPVGTALGADWFVEGQYVDVRAACKGKGFAGGMKRHGWSGQPASHGQSLTHRTMGSAGGSQGSGSRVIPGKKMPGRMGGQTVTVQNLKVLKVDRENGILVVHGCVPGPKSAVVRVQDANKKPWPEMPGIPAESIPEAAEGPSATASA